MEMKNIFKLSFFVVLFTIVSCKDDETDLTFELRDRAEVYEEDIAEIEAYLQDNYLEVDGDLNATVTKIDNGQTSIWDQTAYPLQSITVKNDVRTTNFVTGVSTDVVDYKLYYIIINEGGGSYPSQVDSTFVAYKGWDLENEVFDQNNQGIWFTYPQTSSIDPISISGFRQILTKIKTPETITENTSTGAVLYENYGTALVFIPSGLGYFSGSVGGASYNPIAFQVKLYNKKENDQDRDRVKSIYEDINGNGDFFDDDTDGDNIPDFLDVDDDGDGVITKTEIRLEYIDNNVTKYYYYPFNGAVTDDPTTVYYDETKGIPSCSGDFTTIPRLRKHLDSSCR